MSIGNYCRRSICKVTPDATIVRVAQILRDEHVGSVIVVQDQKPLGIVTDRDITVRVLAEDRDPATTKVSEIMSKPLVTVPPEAGVAEAARLMRGARIRRVPVVTKEGRLFGVIAMDDLMIRFARQFSALSRTVRREQQNEDRP